MMQVKSEAVSILRAMPCVPAGANRPSHFSAEEEPETEEGDNSLDEAAKVEREYVRRRLRDEMGREPSEEEIDEWLRRHTEGY